MTAVTKKENKMPNWCEQDLVVSGPTQNLKEFIEFAKSNSEDPEDSQDQRLLDANKFIPYPEHFKKADDERRELEKIAHVTKNYEPLKNHKDGYNQGGYEWCIENWGSKWNFSEVSLDTKDIDKGRGKGKGKILYTYSTAWAPVTKLIFAMSKKFPTLKFHLDYFERGMQFKGTFVVQDGFITKNVTSKYSGNRGG